MGLLRFAGVVGLGGGGVGLARLLLHPLHLLPILCIVLLLEIGIRLEQRRIRLIGGIKIARCWRCGGGGGSHWRRSWRACCRLVAYARVLLFDVAQDVLNVAIGKS